MRYRINTLEERLGSLTSFVDSPNPEQTAPSSVGSQVQLNVEVLCQELSANIVKLEKVSDVFAGLGGQRGRVHQVPRGRVFAVCL